MTATWRNTPRQDSLILSKFATLDKVWPAMYDDFPSSGATTALKFYDDGGNVIGTVAGVVETKQLVYLISDTSVLDTIPAGAAYELFITTSDGPYKIEYGTVIRREASFYEVPPIFDSSPRVFSDPLNRTAVGKWWINVVPNVVMHNIGSDIYCMGQDIGLLFSAAATRYIRPLATDDWSITWSTFYNGLAIGPAGYGKMRLHAACNYTIDSGLAIDVQANAGDSGSVHLGYITEPTAQVDLASVASPLSIGTDTWTAAYDKASDTVTVKRGSTTILSYPHPPIPHGPGFRYFGFSWNSGLAATGPLLQSVVASDV